MTLSRTILVATSLAVSVLTGCSTHTMTMKYQPPAAVAVTAVPSSIVVGSVTDSRNTDSNWLGANVYTDIDTADAVARVFQGALETRGMLGDATTANYRIDINLAKFESSQKINKTTQADIAIAVNEIRSGQIVFQRHYRTTYETGHVSLGRAETPRALGEFANLALNESIDQMLDDPDLRDVIQPRSAQVQNQRPGQGILAARLGH